MSHCDGLMHEVFGQLLVIDESIAAEAQRAGCPRCAGRLDRADYPRKPRGLVGVSEELCGRRHSFCCAREGCRRRLTPPSVRFAGRRVYAAPVVVLAVLCAAARRAAEVPIRTVRRWRGWWATAPSTRWWPIIAGRLREPVCELPGELWHRHQGRADQRLQGLWRLLSPLVATPSWSRSRRDL